MPLTFEQFEAERLAELTSGASVRDEHGMIGTIVSRSDARALVECADGLVREYSVSRIHASVNPIRDNR